MNNKLEVLKTSTICQNNVYLQKEIREKYDLNEGDKVMWCADEDGRLILTKAEIETQPSSYIDLLDKKK